MTFITRRARAHFFGRSPSPLRVQLRRTSAIWRHLDPSPLVGSVCACGNRATALDHRAASESIEETVTHEIGEVFTKEGRLRKFCDGREIA